MIVGGMLAICCAPGSEASTPSATVAGTQAPPSTPQPTGTPSPTPTPEPTATPGVTLIPLPAGIAGIPGATEPSVELSPATPSGELEVGVPRDFRLGHCGLISPIDIDGSLWDPVAGHDGAGGPLTDDQVGDLINGTRTVVVLTDQNTLVMQTEHGAVVTLTRHDGPRDYLLCD